MAKATSTLFALQLVGVAGCRTERQTDYKDQLLLRTWTTPTTNRCDFTTANNSSV